MNAALAFGRLTPSEFHAWQEGQNAAYELVGGLPLKMMTGARQQHDAITLNILSGLKASLRGQRCRPFTQDIAVRIPNGNLRRPDAGVMCGPYEPDSFEATEPVLVVEVLSPSTSGFDRFRKLEEYKSVKTLRAILLVDPGSAALNVYLRQDEQAAWMASFVDGPDTTVEIPAIGLSLPLSLIYEGVGT